MSVGTGYSLWLMQDRREPMFSQLQEVITTVARIYTTPVFPPHATLIADVPGSDVEMKEKTLALCQMLPPLVIRMGELGSNHIYFQQLFACVELTPQLQGAHAYAKKQVFRVERPPYFPHVSFAYGELSHEEVGYLEGIVRQGGKVEGQNFVATTIELWQTIGPVQDWRRIGGFPLEGENAARF